jgi:acyl carrier protein
MAVNTPVPEDLQASRDQQIAIGISPDEGVDVFERVLQSRLSNVAVSTTDFRPRLKIVSIKEDVAWSKEVASPNTFRYPRPELDHACVEPKTNSEQEIANIWCDVLGLTELGTRDNFFTELNGHSLLATQVVSRLRQSFAVEFTLRQFFDCPTICELAQAIDTLTADRAAEFPKTRNTAA